MTTENATKQALSGLLRKILSGVSVEWLTLLPELWPLIRRWWGLHHPQGMYEMLEYGSTLELSEPQGQLAIFKKQQKVRFLQNNILVFPDYAWGEGEIFAEYACSPGRVVDKYKEGDRWNVLISLREAKQAGDITDFHINRTIKHGFTQAEEFWQLEIRHHTKRLRASIIFPKERRCQRAVLLERSNNKSTVLGPECFSDLPDGRQQLTWETRRVKHFEVYTIKWRW